MKINSVQRDVTLKQGNSGHLSKFKNFREKNSADIYDRGYNAEFSGSFTGQESKAAANAIKKGSKILESNWFQNLTEYSDNHNVSGSALAALLLAGIMRPVTIMSLPGKKDKDDKIYASGHSMASGVIGFVISTILTSPFDESIKKYFKNPNKYAPQRLNTKSAKKPQVTVERLKKASSYLKGKLEKEKTAKYYQPLLKKFTAQTDKMEMFAKNIPDWIIAIPRATLTVALIPVILKYVFGLEKKKKPEPVEIIKEPQTMNFIEKPIFQSVKGGVK